MASVPTRYPEKRIDESENLLQDSLNEAEEQEEGVLKFWGESPRLEQGVVLPEKSEFGSHPPEAAQRA